MNITKMDGIIKALNLLFFGKPAYLAMVLIKLQSRKSPAKPQCKRNMSAAAKRIPAIITNGLPLKVFTDIKRFAI